MSIMDNLKSAFDVLLHPGKETKKGMSIGDALKFYYSVMIIPLILGVIVSLALNASNLTVGVISVAGILLSFVVLFPIGILVDAGLYHLVIGRLFKLYKGDYSKPVMAFTYAMMPSVLVYWLVGPLTSKAGFLGGLAGVAPALGATYVVGEVLSIIFGIWSIVIMIIALSNQVAISRLKALGTLLLEWIIIGIILIVALIVIMKFKGSNSSSFPIGA